jgi:hypothetical protein
VSFVSVEYVRSLVTTGKSDTVLQDIIDTEEEALVVRLGAPPDGETIVTEVQVLDPCGPSIFLNRPIASIESITEAAAPGETATTLEATDYYVIPKQGRLIRLADGTDWGRVVTVEYVPGDSPGKWRQVIVELVRLALEQTAMQSESVAGEYSYTAPEWEAKRAQLYRRLQFPIAA